MPTHPRHSSRSHDQSCASVMQVRRPRQSSPPLGSGGGLLRGVAALQSWSPVGLPVEVLQHVPRPGRPRTSGVHGAGLCEYCCCTSFLCVSPSVAPAWPSVALTWPASVPLQLTQVLSCAQSHTRPLSKLIRYENMDNALDSMDQSLLSLAQSKHRQHPSLLLRVSCKCFTMCPSSERLQQHLPQLDRRLADPTQCL